MNRAAKRIVLSAIIFLLSLAVNTSCHPKVKSPSDLTLKDKSIIAGYAYSAMDSYLSQQPKADLAGKRHLELDFDKVFVSLYKKNILLGCRSALAKDSPGNKLFNGLKEASERALEDRRFVGASVKKLDKDNFIVISILFNKKEMAQNRLDYLREEVEPGIHSLALEKGNKRVYFISCVAITKQYSLETILKRLCNRAGFDGDCYLEDDANIYRYDTAVFKANKEGSISDLYRFNILIDEKEVSQNMIVKAMELACDWALNNIDPKTGRLEYAYYPASDRHLGKDQHTRQLAMLWALAEIKDFLKTEKLDNLIKRTFDHYLAYERRKDGYSYLALNEDPSIAYNAFMIMALLKADLPLKEALLERLAKGILSMQLPDGSYRTNFISASIKGIDYYPGESVLALMKLYNATNNPAYLDSVKRAFYYYRGYWRKNKNTAFIPWHTQAYYLLHRETPDKEIADFVFQMNDWLIDNYQIYQSRYIDEIGGFPKKAPGNCQASSYLEGINDAYSLAVETGDRRHRDNYRRAIALGTKFILQSQYNKGNSFYLPNPKRAIGGIRQTLTDNKQRVDYLQHFLTAILKAYNNQIFE